MVRRRRCRRPLVRLGSCSRRTDEWDKIYSIRLSVIYPYKHGPSVDASASALTCSFFIWLHLFGRPPSTIEDHRPPTTDHRPPHRIASHEHRTATMTSEQSKSNVSEPSEMEPKDALQFLSYTRAKLKRKLESNDDDDDDDERAQNNFDLEQTIREIRALITVNDEIHREIFSRCMVDSRTSSIEEINIKRFAFKTIQKRQKDSKVELISQPEFDEGTFDSFPLTQLPSCLGDMIVPKYKASHHSLFVDYDDYDDYFQKALMLFSEDALGLFLPKLKAHLEAAQVCLGVIHEWAMQPTNDLSFIGLNFQDVLKIPTKIKRDAAFAGSNSVNRLVVPSPGRPADARE
jgi:hypothetical protein